MWIFLTDAFLSIVNKGGDGTTLLVRARRAGDIERVFPGAEVIEGVGSDYRYRARIDRDSVAQRLAEQVRGIRYANFKATVKDSRRGHAYLDVWDVMRKAPE